VLEVDIAAVHGDIPTLSMKKGPRASNIADLLHKGFIWGCIGLTAYGFVLGGFRVYRYVNVTRPQRQAIQEKTLLSEDNQKDPEELKL
jgi:hypothetical protein